VSPGIIVAGTKQRDQKEIISADTLTVLLVCERLGVSPPENCACGIIYLVENSNRFHRETVE